MDLAKLREILPDIVALVVVLFSAWLRSRSSKPRKEISIEVLSEHTLPFVKELQDTIKTSIPSPKQVRLISVRVRNTGRAAILSSDYKEPIQLAFNEPVLSSAFAEGKATSLTPLEPETDQYAVVLPPLRLRPNGFLTINTLIPEGESHITVNGSIANGEIVMEDPHPQPIIGSWN